MQKNTNNNPPPKQREESNKKSILDSLQEPNPWPPRLPETSQTKLPTHINNLRNEGIAPFDIWPRELLPKRLDLVEYSQSVDSRTAVLDMGVYGNQTVEFNGLLDARECFVRSYVQPLRHATEEPRVELGDGVV